MKIHKLISVLMVASLLAAGYVMAEGEPSQAPADPRRAAQSSNLPPLPDGSFRAKVSDVSTNLQAEAAGKGLTNKVPAVSAKVPAKKPVIAAELPPPLITLPQTGQMESHRTGDDGACKKGVAWPDPRFTVLTDTNCVYDNLTGLIWAGNASLDGSKSWEDALMYCEELTLGGRSDWRLPNRNELVSLIDNGQFNVALPPNHPFAEVQTYYYWSATTSAHNTPGAWCVNMGNGIVDSYNKSGRFFVWPVCDGQ